MRKLIVTEFMSLDGVIENPAWTFPYWNDEIAAFKGAETSNNESLLLGRVTYEGFAQAWPSRKDEASGGVYFNGTRKYVVTSTLDKLDWNNSVAIQGDVYEEIKKLKAEDGPDLVIHGSASLARSLLQQGLIDRIRLLIYPVVIGKGLRLFDESSSAKLNLLESKSISSGVVSLIYEPIQE